MRISFICKVTGVDKAMTVASNVSLTEPARLLGSYEEALILTWLFNVWYSTSILRTR